MNQSHAANAASEATGAETLPYRLPLHASHLADLRRVTAKLATMALVLVLLYWVPLPVDPRDFVAYAPMHTLMETASIVVAGLIFTVIWQAPHGQMPWNRLMLGCAFAAVGLLDLSHMLSAPGMPDYVTPSGIEKTINFWLVARLLAAASLLVVCVGHGRALGRPQWRFAMLAGVLAIAALAHWIFLWHPDWMPSTFVEGLGLTPFKRAAEYALIGVALIGMAALLWRMRGPLPFNATSLLGALAAMAMSEFLFTLYSDVTDYFNVMGHLYKIASYMFLYRAVFVEAVEHPYLALNATQSRLKATLEAVPDLIFELDREGRYHRYHSPPSDLLAAPPEDFLGRTAHEVLPPGAARVVMDALEDAQLRGVATGYEIALDLPVGTRWFELSVSRKAVIAGESPRFIVVSRDITERTQAAATLLERAGFITAIIDNTPGMLVYWTADLHCAFANQQCMDWFGRTRAQIQGEHMRDILGEALFHQNEPYVRAALRGENQQFERSLLHLDGQTSMYTWIQYIAHRVEGSVQGVFVFVSDITPMKQQQEMLEQSRYFNISVLDSISDTIAVLDQHGTIVAVNEAWRRYARDNGAAISAEAIGTNYLGVCDQANGPESEIGTATANGIRAVLAGTLSEFELEYPCHAPHEQRWFHMHVTRMRGPKHGAVVTHRDITGQRLAAEELRLSEENLAITLQSIGDAVIATDADGVVTRMNTAAEQLTGWPATAAIGLPLDEVFVVVNAETRTPTPSPVQLVMQRGEVIGLSNHTLLLARDGREHQIADTAAPMRDAAGSIVGVVLVIIDVTETYRIQGDLRTSLQEKVALLNEVHHRVKNNLQIISSLLRMEARRSAHTDTRGVLQQMQSRIQAMAMLHESLYRSGTFAEVDLGAYLKQLATQAMRTLASQPAKVELQLDLASVRVGMDQASTCGLLVNELITNSFKHGFAAGNGGEIRLQLQTEPCTSGIRLTVSDTGVGLPKDFDPTAGKSLGLQLVSDLAGQLGGRLEVGPGSAAVFSVEFAANTLHAAGSAGAKGATEVALV